MHPSLNAEFKPPPPLIPKEIMGRNEPCWCGSGKKWKKCHKDRHLQQAPPIGKLLNELHVNQKHGICLHPEASRKNCTNKIAKAHTVQRAGGLSAIAESGHVISVKKACDNLHTNEGKIIPGRIGIGNASTFMGFCTTHDNSLFEPIERNSFSLDHEAAFLLAFRALAYEFLTKKNSIDAIPIQRESDRGRDFKTQVYIQQYIHTHLAGLKRGMQDLESWKNEYDKRFHEQNYEMMSHCAVEFEGVLPFVCCGGFHPEIDFNGRKLQIITRGDHNFEHVCINVSVIGKKSFLAFGWNGKKDGPAEQFVKSFKSIENDEKANAALILAVEQSENTYFNPTWWDSLCGTNKNHLISRMQSGIGLLSQRSESTYLNLVNIIPPVNISSEIGSI